MNPLRERPRADVAHEEDDPQHVRCSARRWHACIPSNSVNTFPSPHCQRCRVSDGMQPAVIFCQETRYLSCSFDEAPTKYKRRVIDPPRLGNRYMGQSWPLARVTNAGLLTL